LCRERSKESFHDKHCKLQSCFEQLEHMLLGEVLGRAILLGDSLQFHETC